MKNNIPRIVIPIIVLVATVGLTAAALATKKHADDIRANAMAPPKPAMGVSVSVASVEWRARSLTVRTNGFLAPVETRTVSPEVSGYIEQQFHEVSDPVSSGHPMFQIDRSLAAIGVEGSEAVVDRAKSQLTLAEENLKRVQRLGEAANPLELTRFSAEHQVALASVREAEAAHHEARVLFDKTDVTSPLNGFVSRIYRRQGEFAHAGQPIVEVIETGTLKLLIQLDDREVVIFATNDPAEIYVPALPTKSFDGKILRIFPSAALDSRKFEVEIAIANVDGHLRPGFYAEATLTAVPDEASAQVPAMPRLAIQIRDGADHCFVIHRDESTGQEIARLVRIETVPLLGSPQFAQVLSGLEVGDRVITTGLQHVTDKAAVLIRD